MKKQILRVNNNQLNNDNYQLLSSGLYIHFPFCSSKCLYCDFYSLPHKEQLIPEYTSALLREIELTQSQCSFDHHVDTIYFGGGTPSLMTAKQIEAILNSLAHHFQLADNPEISIEVNPATVDIVKLIDFFEIGINRLSIGFQSFDPELLKFLGRIHTPNDCTRTYDQARKARFENISTDLIFNVPGQSLQQWQNDLQKVTELNPEHISAYSLTVERGTPLHRLVKNDKIIMPSENTDAAMFKLTRNLLEAAGYSGYETSNFARPGFECQHNLHYWQHAPYLSFGPSAHSFDGKQKRWWNASSLTEYLHTIKKNTLPVVGSEELSNSDIFNEFIFNGLRLQQGIKTTTLIEYFTGDFEKWLELKLIKWKGFLENNNTLKLTNDGLLLTDEISADLFI